MSLFASGYETKPALSVPIHVVELTNVPPELRMSASVPQQSQSNTQNIPSHSHKTKEWVRTHTLHFNQIEFFFFILKPFHIVDEKHNFFTYCYSVVK